jgi:hypothetical protein
MGHIRVSHPTGRLDVVPICYRQIGRQLKLLRLLRLALPNNGHYQPYEGAVIGRAPFNYMTLCGPKHS